MKELLLMRHAKSSWEDPNIDDFDRPLNKRGISNAPEMGMRLKTKGFSADLIVSSSAARALSTAKYIANKIGYSESEIVEQPKIYEAGAGDLIKVVRNLPDKANTVVLIGHNPGMQLIAYYLTSKTILKFPTCGAILIRFKSQRWKDIEPVTGEIIFYESPKKNIIFSN